MEGVVCAQTRQGRCRPGRTAFSIPLLALILLVGLAAPAGAWQVSFDGVGKRTYDGFRAVAFHSSGDLIASGYSITHDGDDTDCGFFIVRLERATGKEVWHHAPPTERAGLRDCVREVRLLVDTHGDVVVSLRGDVFKLAGETGVPLWSQHVGGFPYDGPAHRSLTLDPAGNPLVVGGFTDSGLDNETDLVVAKLDRTTGVELWRQRRHGTYEVRPNDFREAFNAATGVAADARGDVLVVGYLIDAVPLDWDAHHREPHPIAMKLSGADGSELWRVDSEGVFLRGDPHTVVAVDTRGDLLQLGDGASVIKRSGATGAQMWRYDYGSEGSTADFGDLALAADGSAVASWTVWEPSTSVAHILAAKVDASTGTERWHTAVEKDDGLDDWTRGLATDASGNAVLAFESQLVEYRFEDVFIELGATDGAVRWRLVPDPTGDPGENLFGQVGAAAVAADGTAIAVAGSEIVERQRDGVALLLASDGKQSWGHVESGHEPSRDVAHAVVELPGGDVVAAGEIVDQFGAARMVVYRLAARTGSTVWTRDLGEGRATAVVRDGAGDVVVAGRPDEDASPVVVKLAGADGAERWRFSPDGAAAFSTDPEALAIAPEGDVFFASGRNAAVATETIVLRIAGSTGTEIWRRVLANRQLPSIAVDLRGDLVVLGNEGNGRAAVEKLDGATGELRWSALRILSSYVPALAVAATGDVVVAGNLLGNPYPGGLVALDLDGASGDERWRRRLGPGNGARLAITPASDVIAAVNTVDLPHPFSIRVDRIDGATGQRRWSQSFARENGCALSSLASDDAGNALVGGCDFDGAWEFGLDVAKLAARGGSLGWRISQDAIFLRGDGVAGAEAIVPDAAGNLTVAGATVRGQRGPDFTVSKLGPDGGDALAELPDRACATTIAGAGKAYLLAVVTALQSCRDRIAHGHLAIAPRACSTEPRTQRAIERARNRARSALGERCDADLLASSVCTSSASQGDGAADGAACLIAAHDAAARDLLAAELDKGGTGSAGEAASCQSEIAVVGRRFARSAIAALQRCRARGSSTTTCTGDLDYVAALRRAALRLRPHLAERCDAEQLTAIAPCATTVDGLLTEAGDDGCLFRTHRAAVERAVMSER